MTKAIYIGFSVLYNFIIALLAQDLSITTTGASLPDTANNLGFKLSFLNDLLKTFGSMLTFRLEGIPPALIIIFFYIPNIVLLLVFAGFIFNRN